MSLMTCWCQHECRLGWKGMLNAHNLPLVTPQPMSPIRVGLWSPQAPASGSLRVSALVTKPEDRTSRCAMQTRGRARACLPRPLKSVRMGMSGDRQGSCQPSCSEMDIISGKTAEGTVPSANQTLYYAPATMFCRKVPFASREEVGP
jgi:hypothetical protein